MPAKNYDNPKCPNCANVMRKNGLSVYRVQKYRCDICGYSYGGDRAIGGQCVDPQNGPLTETQRNRRYRQRKRGRLQ